MSLSALPAELGLPMVYLVDDEDVVREAIAWLLRSRRILSEGHHSAEAFEAALDAIPALRADEWPRSPSCLLLDLRMNGMSGLALFERLVARGLTQAMPVIFLTGHGDVPTAVAAVKRGAFDFVEKPFSNNTLVDRIEQALLASADALLAQRERAMRLRAGLQRQLDAVDEGVVGEGLLDEIESSALDRGHRGRHVAVAGQEDHRQRLQQAALGQPLEQRQAAGAGHAHVQHQAAR